jgi:hypothetical protein
MTDLSPANNVMGFYHNVHKLHHVVINDGRSQFRSIGAHHGTAPIHQYKQFMEGSLLFRVVVVDLTTDFDLDRIRFILIGVDQIVGIEFEDDPTFLITPLRRPMRRRELAVCTHKLERQIHRSAGIEKG